MRWTLHITLSVTSLSLCNSTKPYVCSFLLSFLFDHILFGFSKFIILYLYWPNPCNVTHYLISSNSRDIWLSTLLLLRATRGNSIPIPFYKWYQWFHSMDFIWMIVWISMLVGYKLDNYNSQLTRCKHQISFHFDLRKKKSVVH